MSKKSERLKPLINAMAEWAVDDAIAEAEQFAGKKRTRLPREVYKKELAKAKPGPAKPAPKRKRKPPQT